MKLNGWKWPEPNDRWRPARPAAPIFEQKRWQADKPYWVPFRSGGWYYTDWHIFDLCPVLLDFIVLIPPLRL